MEKAHVPVIVGGILTLFGWVWGLEVGTIHDWYKWMWGPPLCGLAFGLIAALLIFNPFREPPK